MKKTLISLALIIFSGFLTVDAQSASDALTNGINACLSTIIPSLFAFMVISSFLLSTGLNRFLFRPLFAISRFWFKGDENIFAVFIISLFGGYPVGIKLFSELTAYNKNYNEIAEKYLSFCYCPSPTFAIGIIGLGLFKSSQAGLIVYLSNVLACIVLAVSMNLFSKKSSLPPIKRTEQIDFSKLSEAISGTVKTLSVICASILLFRLVSAFFDAIGLFSFFNAEIASILRAVFEVSSLTECCANFNLLPFYSALVSFGGLCIIFQTVALAPKGFRLRYFFLGRVCCSFLSFLFTNILLRFFTPTLTVSAHNPVKVFSVSPICSFCLIIMCYILLKLPQKNSRK